MMRILVITALIFISLSLSVTFARAAGQLQAPNVPTIFTNADGSACDSLCLFGIYPHDQGKSGLEARLKAHPALKNALNEIYPDELAVFADGRYVVTLAQSGSDRRPSLIVYVQPRIPLTLGEVIAWLGVPLSVDSRSRNQLNPRLYFQRALISVETASQHHRFSLDDQVVQINLSSQPFYVRSPYSTWHGFTRFETSSR